MKHIFLAVVLTLTTGFALAESYTSAENNWPPFISKERADDGVAIALIREIFKRSGNEMSFDELPWSRAIDSVKTGAVDILPGVWHNEERTKYLIYSEPYLYNRIVFIKKKGDGFEYDGIGSLEGKKVGTVQDYNYGDEFLKAEHFKRISTVGLINNVRKLVNGRIDLTLEDEIVARSDIMSKTPELADQVDYSKNALSEVGLHIACGKANPKCPQIIEQFNKGLKAMQDDGSLASFLKDNGL